MWPVFFKKNLIVGDPKQNIAICTLWSKKEIFTDKLSKDKYSVIGNLYSGEGINYLLKNLLANPVIKYLVICGADLNKSSLALINFFKKGIDEKGKIVDFDAYLHQNISPELVKVLRENVKIIDLRGREEELPELIKSISKKENQFISPVVLPDQINTEEALTSEIIGFKIEGSLSKAWLQILDLIMKFGEIKKSEHEFKQKEILDVVAVIKKDFSLESYSGLEKKEIQNYINSFFSHEENDLEYTYGRRLFKFPFQRASNKFEAELKFFINQIERITEKIKKVHHSRRILACLWNPFVDLDSKNPPCLTQITWNVKNGKLYQTSIFRSHDLFKAYLLNCLALRKLQENIAREADIPLGDMIVISQSAHIYSNSWERAEEILNNNYRNKELIFEEDQAGYFRIWLNGKEIVVQHYLRDGRKTKFKFRGKNPISIYRTILNENLVSKMDHAAYLGKELGRAKHCLENKKEYVQDKA